MLIAAFGVALVLWVVLVRRLWGVRPGLALLPAVVLTAAAVVAVATVHVRRATSTSLPAAVMPAAPADGHIEPSDPRVASAFVVLRAHGLAAALTELEGVAKRDSAVLRDAHQLAHALGRDAVTAAGDASVLKDCQPAFGAGCYHGVIEAFLRARGRIDMGELERLCEGAGRPERRGAVYECFHGLGHGVFGALNLDLDSTLHECDRLTRPDGANWCHAGAFMEAINAALAELDGASTVGHVPLHAHGGMSHGGTAHGGHDARGKIMLDRTDPYSPCDKYAGRYAASCWMFQAFVLLRTHDFRSAAALHACDGAPATDIERCYYGIGLQFAGLFQRDAAWIVAQCGQGQPSHAPACAAGAARTLGAIDWSGARGTDFCLASPVDWKSACYREVAAMLLVYGSDAERREACARFESGYTNTCRFFSAGARGRLSML